MSYINKPPSFFQNKKVEEICNYYSTEETKIEAAKAAKANLKPCEFSSSDKILCGVQESNLFTRAFFSDTNVAEVQKLLRYKLYKETDSRHILFNQDKIELLIIMKSQYLQFAKIPQSTKHYPQEIGRLNSMTVKHSIPLILNQIQQHIDYIKDSSELPKSLPNPINVSNANTIINRSTTDVLFGDGEFFKKN